MSDLRKAAEMALEALETLNSGDTYKTHNAATALRQALSNEFNPDWNQVEALQESLREHMAEIQRLRQALAQPEQEPLVWMNKYGHVASFQNEEYKDPLYTAPPKREWEELDVNDVMGLIAEHITDPSPELMDELYGLIAGADMLLQEKNSASSD